MMVEEHYDEDSLLALLSVDGASSNHLSACAECRDKLDTFRLVADVLREEATWDERPLDETPNPRTIATLRAFADQMAAEDADAALYLEELLAGSRETWMGNLHHHPEFRTAGVVRKLIEAIPAALDAMPRDAVELTALATEIAEHLDSSTNAADTVSRLRGAAWRERAYALFYTGDFANAERALCASESHFNESCVNEYDLARVELVRALIYRPLQRFADARLSADAAFDAFNEFGDRSRAHSARTIKALLNQNTGEYRTALSIWLSILRELSPTENCDQFARTLGNTANCYRELGDWQAALSYADAALDLFEELGNVSETARMRWNVARLLMALGRTDEALERVRRAGSELEALGMFGESTLASLDAAAILLLNRAYSDVEMICSRAMERFATTGLQESRHALSALAYLREAAHARHMTPVLVQQVTQFIRRTKTEPQLLFLATPA